MALFAVAQNANGQGPIYTLTVVVEGVSQAEWTIF
jgi:hypothetical protein